MSQIPDYFQLDFAPIEGNPFALARTTCADAVRAAQDVTIDNNALESLAARLDSEAVRDVAKGTVVGGNPAIEIRGSETG